VAKVESTTGTVATSSSYEIKVLANTVAPVVMDMNGDGLMSYNQVKMDMNADGVLDTTAWVAAQDGVLVRDTFGDGSVRSTSQFAFARHSGETDLQGLAALFDTNQDKVLDAKDAQFSEFAVWQDADADGVADAGEVKHLDDLGITEIQLNSDGVHSTPAAGVSVAGHSTAQLANGTSMLVADAAFEYTQGTKAMDPGSMTPMSLIVKGANTTIDLASFIAHNGNPDVAQVDLTGTGDNTVKLDLNAVLSMQGTADNLDTPVDESSMLVVNGNAGDTVQLVGGINWTTVTSDVSGASLNSTYGTGYNFAPGDLYTQLSYGGGTLFIDEAMTRTNL
jgi:hypothetical protein